MQWMQDIRKAFNVMKAVVRHADNLYIYMSVSSEAMIHQGTMALTMKKYFVN